MKQCPVCKTIYNDETMSFCLADGTNLVLLPEPAETVQMSFNKNPLRVNIAPDSTPTVFAVPTSNPPVKKGVSPIIVAVLGLVLLLVIIGFAGFAVYVAMKPGEDKNLAAAASPTPTASPKLSQTTTPDNKTDELKEKLANLEKQIQDKKNQKNTPPVEPFSTSPSNAVTARANSPRDGFLALRSEPDSESGYRITKIPHGANLTVLGCPKPSNVGKMPGHWCQVIYNGQSGWAFDAFMIF